MKIALLKGIKKSYVSDIITDFEEVSPNDKPDVLFLRSEKLKEFDVPESLFAICRAGSGTDNIPLDYCTKKGIVVFNAPGANANSVKEITIALLIASARNIPSILKYVDYRLGWSREAIEKNRAGFKGKEIYGKTLGIVGVGAIGSMVGQAAADLGMYVCGFDKYAPDKNFRRIRRAKNLEEVAGCDFISIHCALTNETAGILDKNFFSRVKPGTILLNFARPELVDNDALKAALANSRIAQYLSDFHDPDLRSNFPGVTTLNHAGANTEEAEENAQVKVARQFLDFWTSGTVENSTNFENCKPEPPTGCRFLIMNRNIPGMEHKIKGILAEAGHNICYSLDKSPADNPTGYNIIDIENESGLTGEAAKKISEIEGVLKVRTINPRR